MTRILDWKSRHDPRSLTFPVADTISQTPVRKDKTWTPGPIIDQGQEGACVGFGWTDEATATPTPVKLKDATKFAQGLYELAKTLDEYPGTNYDGTSVLAGAKAMGKKGLLKEYRWAFSIDDVVNSLLVHGPVVLGIDWYEDMFNPVNGDVLRVSGALAGGHCILAVGYRVASIDGADAIVLQNSWGPSWGKGGLARIKVSDLARLLAGNGEACVPVRRSYGPGGL